MAEPDEQAREPGVGARVAGLNELTDDALGFGLLELRTARDVVLRPRPVLEAWMVAGASGGGRYARPLRLYLALNALLMLVLFLKGGADLMLLETPASVMDALVEASGKSRDAFMADADNWMSLVMVPVLALAYAGVAAPLLRWWDPEDLGWRRGFRAAFAYLCAWTVPVLPLSWWAYDTGPGGAVAGGALFVIGLVAFMRMGAGRWWRSPAEGLGKAVVLSLAIQLAALVAFVPILFIGLAAARYG